eukprot:Lithocolla_globosa_v1_NODE_3425_length_1674_cov_3.421248.p1 type:complete len:453 gc:universal NODE_3425_length_1674_cov_3.421248:1370-12(-)
MVVNQHQVADHPLEWWSSIFKNTISSIGNTLLVGIPYHEPVALTRAWCMWEILCTLDTSTTLTLLLPPSDRKMMLAKRAFKYQPSMHVDSRRMQASKAIDLKVIQQALEGSIGYDAFDKVIKAQLQSVFLAPIWEQRCNPNEVPRTLTEKLGALLLTVCGEKVGELFNNAALTGRLLSSAEKTTIQRLLHLGAIDVNHDLWSCCYNMKYPNNYRIYGWNWSTPDEYARIAQPLLESAIDAQRVDDVALVLQLGADPTSKTFGTGGKTMLGLASEGSHPIKQLLEAAIVEWTASPKSFNLSPFLCLQCENECHPSDKFQFSSCGHVYCHPCASRALLGQFTNTNGHLSGNDDSGNGENSRARESVDLLLECPVCANPVDNNGFRVVELVHREPGAQQFVRCLVKNVFSEFEQEARVFFCSFEDCLGVFVRWGNNTVPPEFCLFCQTKPDRKTK